MKRTSVRLQHLVAQISIPFTFGVSLLLLRGFLGYRWENLKAFRAKIRSLVGHQEHPVILCPNHLTMIDSLLLIWAMTPAWKAISKPRLFPWNTPEKKNFAHNAVLRFFCYIGKCLPVVRQGPPEKTKTFLDKVKVLLVRGQSLMMFPEGTRSVSGRVDTQNFAYGIGKIIDDLRRDGLQPRVLCLYLRGKKQTGKTAVPKRGDRFFIDAELVEPQTAHQGLRAARDLATQIVQRLAGMEAAYFAR
ncbi:MAG TPA: lysophospholipid acyltransferase family protein [Spirochaetia bacterium]|nr:lysophospholipid acyltransferase family protein [Spirochaetia bacterium]